MVLDHTTRPAAARRRARGACPVSLAPPRAPDRVPLPGYCRPTDGEGDCARGDGGAWETRKHKLHSLQACAAKCRACARCHVVSYSRLHHDCSWFHHCHDRAGPYELDQHKLGFVDSGWDYVTLRVTRGGKSDAGGRGAMAGATTRYREEFPGAVSAGAVVELH